MRTAATSVARPRVFAFLVAFVLACAAALLAVPAAHAAAVNNAEALRSEVSSSGTDSTVTLAADIDVTGVLATGRSLTLDLAGHHLTADGVELAPGSDLRIVDGVGGGALTTAAPAGSRRAGIRTTDAALVINGGTITAIGAPGVEGGDGGAGIGGSVDGDAGNVFIAGGSVTATGGPRSAGIGSGFRGMGGRVVITGGTVEARSELHGAGIGAGAVAATSGEVLITGGTVTALGGRGGAGIGGGLSSQGATVDLLGGEIVARSELGLGIGGGYAGGANEDGGDVVIGEHARVTASSSSHEISAIGARHYVPDNGEPPFGSLTVAGELILPADTALIVQDGITVPVTATGRITGDGAIKGAGTIANAGAITNADVSVDVTGHHYLVTFEPNLPVGEETPERVRVYASTFAAGGRDLAPSPAAGTLAGWFSAREGGEEFTTTTPLTADRTVYAQWTPDRIALRPETTAVTAGDVVPFEVELLSDQLPIRDVTDEVVVSETEGVDVTDDGVLLTRAGDAIVTVTLPGEPELTTTATIAVTPGDIASLALSLPDRVDQGESLTATVEGADRFGNARPDAPELVTLTSDHPSDVIDGLTITFPAASEHVITATLDSDPSVTDSATVTVVPAAVPEPPAEEPSPEEPAVDQPVRPSAGGPARAGGALPDAGGVDAALVLAAVGLVAGAAVVLGAARTRRS
ncbi:InlB B-repeat-containing protein [Aeromicrobium phragmitis]|uniref:InlB B-repeat-containing protein n=1 Tax=Aeromicrobium phragmitis TaxID=2478914 RepID=UPI00105F664E|nr:InlB B-repeat-containing protein [Aeromicrobium phragmitis]